MSLQAGGDRTLSSFDLIRAKVAFDWLIRAKVASMIEVREGEYNDREGSIYLKNHCLTTYYEMYQSWETYPRLSTPLSFIELERLSMISYLKVSISFETSSFQVSVFSKLSDFVMIIIMIACNPSVFSL